MRFDVNIANLFSIPVADVYLGNDPANRTMNEALIKDILEDLNIEGNSLRSGVNVKQSITKIENRKTSFKTLQRDITEISLQFLKYIGLREDIIDKCVVDTFWGNVTTEPAFHIPHTHGLERGGHIWTGVYFPCYMVDITDREKIIFKNEEETNVKAGDLILQDPSFEAKTAMLNSLWKNANSADHYSKNSYCITPVEGLLVLFPAYMIHYVEPTFSASKQNARVSISFMIGRY